MADDSITVSVTVRSADSGCTTTYCEYRRLAAETGAETSLTHRDTHRLSFKYVGVVDGSCMGISKTAPETLDITGTPVIGCTVQLTYESVQDTVTTVTGELLQDDDGTLLIADDENNRHLAVHYDTANPDVRTLADRSASDGRKIGDASIILFERDVRDLPRGEVLDVIDACEPGGTVIVNGTEYGVVTAGTNTLEFASREYGVRSLGVVQIHQRKGLVARRPGAPDDAPSDTDDLELTQIEPGRSRDEVEQAGETDALFGVPIQDVSRGDRIVFSAEMFPYYAKDHPEYNAGERHTFTGEVTAIQPYNESYESPVHTMVETDDGDELMLKGSDTRQLWLYVNTTPDLDQQLNDYSGYDVTIESLHFSHG